MAATYLSADFIQGLGDSASTRTGSADVNASANFALIKVLWGHTAATPAISSVTYNGVTCTAVGAKVDRSINFVNKSTQIFRVNNPATGTNTLTVNFASATNTSTVYIESYSGVDLTTPVEGQDSGTGTGTAINGIPTTTTVSGDVVTGICASGQSSTANLSTSDTQIAEVDYTALTNIIASLAYEDITGSGAQVNWTGTASAAYSWNVVVIKAAGAAAQELTPSLYTNTNTFYSPTVTVGAVTLSPSLFTNANTFYSPTVAQGGAPQTLTPSLFTNSNTFYSPTVSAGAVALEPSLYTNTQTFFSPTVTVGAVTLEPSLFTNTNVFYSPVVTQEGGAQTLAPSLFTNTNAFYAPTVSTGAVTISPSLYTNTSTFYEPTVTTSYTLSPSLFTNTQTFFSPTVTQTGAQTISPELFVNENVFFSPTVTGGSTSSGGGASSAGYWKEWWNKPSYKEAVKKKKLSPKAKEIIKEVAKTLPADTDEITKDQEIALRLKLIADHIGYNPLYLDGLRQELINQQLENEQALQKEEEEAIAMLMMMLV